MAGGSTSEEMDAVDPFDDVTPDKPVSIYDLDEDLPTRAQSSEEIAEYQEKLREKREAAFRSFKPPTDTGSGRPVPRESGPVRIDRLRVPPPMPAADADAPGPNDDPDLDEVLHDVAATLARLPPAPRLPKIEQPRGSLEVIPRLSAPPADAGKPAVVPRSRARLAALALLATTLVGLAVAAVYVFLR